MHLAIEYLARKKLFREWFNIPCSLFVQERGTQNKIAVTINEEFKPSELYCVKHWHICKCKRSQALPSFTEFRVPKSEVFTHQAVVLSGHRLMPYHACPIPFQENGTHHPMSEEIYTFFYDNYLDTFKHREAKVNWLWTEFIMTYLPQLCSRSLYIPLYKSDAEIASDQRSMVATVYSEVWQCWIKWCKYMLYLDGVPGELVFLGEYQQGGLWTEIAPQLSLSRFLH